MKTVLDWLCVCVLVANLFSGRLPFSLWKTCLPSTPWKAREKEQIKTIFDQLLFSFYRYKPLQIIFPLPIYNDKKVERAEWLIRPDKTPVPEQIPYFFNDLSRTILNVENDRLAGITCFIITSIWRSMEWGMQLKIINPFDPNIFLDALASLGKSICLSIDLF